MSNAPVPTPRPRPGWGYIKINRRVHKVKILWDQYNPAHPNDIPVAMFHKTLTVKRDKITFSAS